MYLFEFCYHASNTHRYTNEQKCLFMDKLVTCNFNNDMLAYLYFLRYLDCCLCYFYIFNIATVKLFKPPINDTILKEILTS